MRLILILLPLAAAIAQMTPVEEGSALVKQRCSVGYCHGLEGRAGRAPRLANRGFERDYLYKVIRSGIPNSSMPAFQATLTDKQIDAVVAYLTSLNPQPLPGDHSAAPLVRPEAAVPAAKVPAGFGDPARGRALFFALDNERNCGVCHGAGGAAPDPAKLKDKPPRELLRDIVTPNAALAPGFPQLEVTLKSGDTWTGIRTEQTATRLRLFDVSVTPPVLRTIPLADIAAQRPLAGSAMPSGDSFSFRDLLDLVAFLKQAPVDPADLVGR